MPVCLQPVAARQHILSNIHRQQRTYYHPQYNHQELCGRRWIYVGNTASVVWPRTVRWCLTLIVIYRW